MNDVSKMINSVDVIIKQFRYVNYEQLVLDTIVRKENYMYLRRIHPVNSNPLYKSIPLKFPGSQA